PIPSTTPSRSPEGQAAHGRGPTLSDGFGSPGGAVPQDGSVPAGVSQPQGPPALPGESVPAPGDQAGMGVPPAGPGGPRGFAGAKGRRLGRKKKVLLGAAGAVVLLGSVGAVAAVVSSGEDEPARRQAEPSVSAAPPAWTVQAGRRLT